MHVCFAMWVAPELTKKAHHPYDAHYAYDTNNAKNPEDGNVRHPVSKSNCLQVESQQQPQRGPERELPPTRALGGCALPC
eukprot:3985771-Amphidinium_carterae.2